MINSEQEFEEQRPRLTAIATRILGSVADAQDIVQEAWLKYSLAPAIDVAPAWLTTVVTRLCLDHLRRRGSTPRDRDVTNIEGAMGDPATDVLLAEQVGEAISIVLDVLSPAERVAFIMHDVFAFSFEEIGVAMGRSPTAVRQLASRARRKFSGQEETEASRAKTADDARVVDAFVAAAHGGDLSALLALLAPGAVMHADLVAQSMGTAPLYDGVRAVAERFQGSRGAMPAMIDGQLGAAWYHAGSLKVAFVFHVEADLIGEVELIADPDVLATLAVARVRRRSKSST